MYDVSVAEAAIRDQLIRGSQMSTMNIGFTGFSVLKNYNWISENALFFVGYCKWMGETLRGRALFDIAGDSEHWI